MLRNKLRHVWLGTVTVAAALAAVGCGTGSGTGTGSGNGTTDQSGQTAHTLSGAAGTTGAGGAGVPVLGPASTGSAGTGVTTGAAPPANAPTGLGSIQQAPGPRSIQEADIYKLVGNTLYILSSKRGLEIVDVTDVQSPKLLSTLPTQSSPRQIYVDGETAYVLTSNVDDVDCGGYKGTCGWNAPSGAITQVDVINVGNPSTPTILGTQQLPGDLQDSRIVGHILYVVGIDASGANTLVASYDVGNPSSFTKVAEVDFRFGDWDIGVFLNVTATRIIVAQTGDTCDLVHDMGSCTDMPVTQFVPIDITDPNGALTLGTSFLGNGVVWDRWAMDFDPASGIFRAVMSSDWNGNSGGGALAVWSAPDTKSAPTLLGSLTFTAGDHVTATAFAGPRVYVSSNTSSSGCPDPVVVLDTTEPGHPVKLGSVAVPGVNDFLYPNGSQLISLGHADQGTSNACGQGQGYISFQGSGQLAVSLFDVSDAANPKLLSEVDFGGAQSTIAANRDDLKKAFLVLNTMGLILVPFQNVDPTSTTTTPAQSATQLIDLNPTSLTLRGAVPHNGLVLRAFPVQNDVVAFSDESLQVLDITNRDTPTTAAELDF